MRGPQQCSTENKSIKSLFKVFACLFLFFIKNLSTNLSKISVSLSDSHLKIANFIPNANKKSTYQSCTSGQIEGQTLMYVNYKDAD